MIARIFKGAAAVACLAGGLLVDAQLVGSQTGAGAQTVSCSNSAELLIAHQDGSLNLETPSVATSCTPAPFYGSLAGKKLAAPIVGVATTPYGGGYWLVGADGGVFTFGDAYFYGSLGRLHLNAPIVGIAPTPDGGGYWLVASDGGVFAFGDANFYGSMGGTQLAAPIVGITADTATGGYWLVASDGGVFAFNAPFYGSMAGTPLAASLRFIESSPDALGYRLVGGDGGVFDFGDAQFYGAGTHLGVYGWGALAETPDGAGYWLATNFAPKGELNVASFGDAVPYSEQYSQGTLTKSPVISAAAYLPYDGGPLPTPPLAPPAYTPPITGSTGTGNPAGYNFPTTYPTGCVAVTSVGGTPPTVVQGPASEDVPVGGTATFTALASSTPAAAIQWQVSVDQGVTFSNIANANTTTLTFPVTPSESGGVYRAVFANPYGYTPTGTATLTVGGAPDVVTEPTDQDLSPGATATFTAAATGDPTPTVQWEESADDSTWYPVTGATSDTLTFTATSADNQTFYRAVFNNSAGSALTTVAELNTVPVAEC